jgi:hypothetical protein
MVKKLLTYIDQYLLHVYWPSQKWNQILLSTWGPGRILALASIFVD